MKGGDPFVFGRGGEEALALARAGVAFEVVPGVSSAIAGPAYAGIPVTQRGHVSQLTIFTGHEDPEKGGSAVDFAQLAKAPGTKVMLMGVERLESITRQLLDAGRTPALPVALVRWATTARQQTLTGTLGDIARRAADAEFRGPGRRGVRRGRQAARGTELVRDAPACSASASSSRARASRPARSAANCARSGPTCSKSPRSASSRPRQLREFAELVKDSHTYEWIVFTSPNGVDAFFQWFYRLFSDARDIGGARIAAVGPATAARLREFHLKVDVQPETAVAEALVEALQKEMSVENLKILLVRPEATREVVAPGTDQARGHRGRGHRVPHRARNRRGRAGPGAGTLPARGRGHDHVRQRFERGKLPRAQAADARRDARGQPRADHLAGVARRGLDGGRGAPAADLDAFAEAIRRHFAAVERQKVAGEADGRWRKAEGRGF